MKLKTRAPSQTEIGRFSTAKVHKYLGLSKLRCSIRNLKSEKIKFKLSQLAFILAWAAVRECCSSEP